MSTPRNNYSNNASFTPSSLATPNSLNETPSSSQDNDKSLMPVTIKQCAKFYQGKTLYGKTVTKLCMIGKVSDLTVNETNIKFVMEDGTGICQCTWWSTTSDDVGFQNGSYVRIFGKWQNSDNSMTVFGCLPLSSMNEVVLHNLDVMYCHYQNTKGQSSMVSKMNFDNEQQVSNNQNDGENNYSGIMYAKNIINVIQNSGNEETGAHIDAIISNSGVKDTEQLKASIQQLVDDGIIYSTVDDEHFGYSN